MKTPTEEQRKEMIQEIIDRMLYLPYDKKRDFIEGLLDAFDEYPLKYHYNDRGIRVYEETFHKNELTLP
jgi:hypothetical protein